MRHALDTRHLSTRAPVDLTERRVGLFGAFGAACFLLLVVFAVLIGRGELDSMVVEGLRSGAELADPHRTYWVDGAARGIAGLGGPAALALIIAAATAHLFFTRGWGPAALLLMAVFGGGVLAVVLKLSFGQTRLTFAPGGLSVFSASFPSANAVLSAIIYPTLGAVLAVAYGHRVVAATLLSVAVAVTLLIGLSRALLGMHLPTDVLAGWCTGIAWASLCWIVMRRSLGGSRAG